MSSLFLFPPPMNQRKLHNLITQTICDLILRGDCSVKISHCVFILKAAPHLPSHLFPTIRSNLSLRD